MGSQPLDNLEQQVTIQDIFIGILKIPGKEGGFLTAIGKGEYLFAPLWNALIERRSNDSMRTVRAMHNLSHRVTTSGIVATGTTLRHLIGSIFIFRRGFLEYAQCVSVSAFQLTTSYFTTLDTQMEYLFMPVSIALVCIACVLLVLQGP